MFYPQITLYSLLLFKLFWLMNASNSLFIFLCFSNIFLDLFVAASKLFFP